MSARCENAHKRFVEVVAHHRLDGQVRPLRFRWEDGPSIQIDTILDVRQAASLKAGGRGIRHLCRSEDREYHLFYDKWWFIEGD